MENPTTPSRPAGAVIWFTGLSGAGKSTLSRALEQQLLARGRHVYVLDGDEVRHGLSSDLGFSHEDRTENIRRVAEVAKLMSHAGIIVIAALVSPYREDRRRARAIVVGGGRQFIEIFVDAPLSVCESRDVKGLYQRARAGKLPDFTGISAPYETPEHAEIVVHSDRENLAESVAHLLRDLDALLGRPKA